MTNLNTPFMIGNVEIPNRTVLAPMAGVTNSAFRTIAKELGAGLVVMIEADRVPEKGLDKIVANEHYVVALTNQSKVVKATFKK